MPPENEETRMRLLQAAGEVFAEHGFDAATIRQICAKAGVNLAAVNYHFGDKEKLYLEAVRLANCSSELDPPDWPPGITPEAKLRFFIEKMLANVLDDNRPAWHAQLMMRELSHPTALCAAVVDAYIRPKAELLGSILDELLPEEMLLSDRHLMGFSVVGQVLFYRVHRPITVLLVGEEEYRGYTISRLAEHITRFTLAGLASARGAQVPSLSGAVGERS